MKFRTASEIVGLMEFEEMGDEWAKEAKAGAKDWGEWYKEVRKELKTVLEPYYAKEVVTKAEKDEIQEKVQQATRKGSAVYRRKKGR